jgi:hypothetical protein
MVELKTKKTEASVEDFLNSLSSETMRNDCFDIVEIMKQATKEEPKMWGSSIIGFGSAHLKYASGRELDWMIGVLMELIQRVVEEATKNWASKKGI